MATLSNTSGSEGCVTLSDLGSSQISATQGSVSNFSSTTVVNDFDGDGTHDNSDTCKYINNVSQIDLDGDQIGDVNVIDANGCFCVIK